MIPIFPCDSRRSKGVPSDSGVFIRLLHGRGAWDSQTCPNFRLWQMAVPIQNDTTAGASDLNQICLKTRNSKDGCTFPTNIFIPTSKSFKTSFWGPFNAKSIIETAFRKSHVNGAPKLKLYSYLHCVPKKTCDHIIFR